MLRRFLVLLVTVAILTPQIVAAQDETPEPGPGASSQLPAASVLGETWVQREILSPAVISRYSSFEMTPDVFAEGAAGIYVGPDGSRVVIVNLIVTDSRVAVRASWEAGTELMDGMAFGTETDYRRQETLDTMAPPAPCVEAKRIEGVESPYALPLGVTMCAQDPDNVWIFLVSGELNGLSGIEASDTLVVTALGG